MKQKQLTENELILELEKAGFEGITKRIISDWRREGLLPDFDNKGHGLGKGLGRAESSWESSALIIEQARWICRMRLAGIGYGDFHLNLWILDHPIHLEDVRDTLLEPLAGQIKLIESKAQEFQQIWHPDKRTDSNIEDIISEEIAKALSEMQCKSLAALSMPQELIEAIANIFLNPEYDLDDFSFAESFSALEEWNSKTQKFELEMFETEGLKAENSTKQNQTIFDLLDNADVIQKYFSLHQVEKAVRECTHEDLAEVQNDMRIFTKIFMILVRTAQTVLRHIELLSDSLSTTDKLLPGLFNSAELLVLADISLRRNGYSETINRVRGEVLNKIEKEFSEMVRTEIAQSAPIIGQAFTQTFEIVERKLSQLATNSL